MAGGVFSVVGAGFDSVAIGFVSDLFVVATLAAAAVAATAAAGGDAAGAAAADVDATDTVAESSTVATAFGAPLPKDGQSPTFEKSLA